jgi:hypothetical protein
MAYDYRIIIPRLRGRGTLWVLPITEHPGSVRNRGTRSNNETERDPCFRRELSLEGQPPNKGTCRTLDLNAELQLLADVDPALVGIR